MRLFFPRNQCADLYGCYEPQIVHCLDGELFLKWKTLKGHQKILIANNNATAELSRVRVPACILLRRSHKEKIN